MAPIGDAPDSSRRPAVVLVGFMGAGKSRALRGLAAAGVEAIDTDLLLEEELGRPIAEFFADRGEGEFRRREEALVAELLDRADGGAIALGGGSLASERVRASLGRHTVAWLETDAETSWERVEGRRPLARDRSRFEALLAERRPIYESVADAILPGRAEAALAAFESLRALAGMPAGTRMAWGESASGQYPAFVGRGLIESGYWPLDGRRFMVTDTVVGDLYGGSIEALAGVIELAPGEQTKTLTETERVLRELAALGATRSDHLVALGGGVVGDLAGFCAAVYQRGVAVVQVPTTLVAQVDSAYGGKTGVDLPEAKNYVGAYHLPAAVLADPAVLRTLSPGELAAGFVEVVKTALIAGGSLWEQVRELERLDPAELDEVIFSCARTKLGVVAADERDAGRRAALNLGHTVGHALEVASAYSGYRHGEAVGIGLLAALELSEAGELRREVEEILERHRLPTRIDRSIPVDAVVEAISMDKKRTAAGVGFVLCPRPGETITGQLIDPDRVRGVLQGLTKP